GGPTPRPPVGVSSDEERKTPRRRRPEQSVPDLPPQTTNVARPAVDAPAWRLPDSPRLVLGDRRGRGRVRALRRRCRADAAVDPVRGTAGASAARPGALSRAPRPSPVRR